MEKEPTLRLRKKFQWGKRILRVLTRLRQKCFPQISGQCLHVTLTLTIRSMRGGVNDAFLYLGGIVLQLYLFCRNQLPYCEGAQTWPFRETTCSCLADILVKVSANSQYKQLHRWVRIPWGDSTPHPQLSSQPWFQVFPIKELRQAVPMRVCPNPWLKVSLSIIKWLVYTTKLEGGFLAK